MCDQENLSGFRRNMTTDRLNRRQFSARVAASGGAAVLAACNGGGAMAGPGADSATVIAREVAIPTSSGTMGGWFYHPASGTFPAVIMWPDIAGVRPASKAMGERLAGEGFAVIVPDPYWRDEGHATFEDFADFMENGGFQTVQPWRDRFSAETVMADTKAIVDWLGRQGAVDSAKGIAARGHCMTGAWTIYAAKASDRVTVAASMHGGGLVTQSPTSPHRMFVDDATYLVAIARNDDAKDPDAKRAIEEALGDAGAMFEVTVYPADHGWTVPDSPAYDKEWAERAYASFLELAEGLKA